MRPPILFLVRQKENAPRPVEEKKRLDEQAERLFVNTGGRANRSAPDRRPRRPCALPWRLKGCGPASDGAADGRGAGPHLPLLLFPRVPLRYALPGQLRKILPTAAHCRAGAGSSGGTHGSRPTAPGGGRIWNPPLRLKEKANSNRQGSAQRSGTRGERSAVKSDNHPDPPPHGPCGSRFFRLPG